LPPSVFANVDKPRPPTANLGSQKSVFFIGTGGSNPSSESDELLEDDLDL
jgi:hypothetical protein